MKLKLPSFPKMDKMRFSKPRLKQKRLQATARRVAPAIDDYECEEPTTRFSTAFLVVLGLHLVAVGGVITFKTIQANHIRDETRIAGPEAVKPAAQRPAQSETDATPAPASVPQTLPAAQQPQNTSLQAGSGTGATINRSYHVKAGDTLPKIAASYNVQAAEIAEANNIKETEKLRPGQVLAIPPGKASSKQSTAEAKKAEATPAKLAASSAAGKTYTVKKGDNPVAIARTFNVSYDELLKLNKIDDPKKLQIGAILKLPPQKKAKAETDRS